MEINEQVEILKSFFRSKTDKGIRQLIKESYISDDISVEEYFGR